MGGHSMIDLENIAQLLTHCMDLTKNLLFSVELVVKLIITVGRCQKSITVRNK